jgi:hypothetical protein
LELVLEEYHLPTRVEVLPEKQLETNAAEVGQASAARNP